MEFLDTTLKVGGVWLLFNLAMLVNQTANWFEKRARSIELENDLMALDVEIAKGKLPAAPAKGAADAC